MTSARGVPTLLVLIALSAPAGLLAGCGGSSNTAPTPTAEIARQTQAYAASVAAVSERTSTRLAEIARTSDYKTAAAARASTQAYATTIRMAATELGKAPVPASIASQHAALVALYTATAERMDALAVKFSGAQDVGQLATQAQAFSAEVQAYSSKELLLRSAIERALAAAVTPPSTPSTPGLGETSDPG